MATRVQEQPLLDGQVADGPSDWQRSRLTSVGHKLYGQHEPSASNRADVPVIADHGSQLGLKVVAEIPSLFRNIERFVHFECGKC